MLGPVPAMRINWDCYAARKGQEEFAIASCFAGNSALCLWGGVGFVAERARGTRAERHS